MSDNENESSQGSQSQEDKPSFPSNTTTTQGDQPKKPIFPDNPTTRRWDGMGTARERSCETDE